MNIATLLKLLMSSLKKEVVGPHSEVVYAQKGEK